jgi:RHS repeat-associated protein
MGHYASVIKTIGSANYTTLYSYDINGNQSGISYPSGRVVSYTFDYADRPYSASGSLQSTISNYVLSTSYEPFGPVHILKYGNGTQTAETFDTRYRLLDNVLSVTASTLPPIADNTYIYGKAPLVLGIRESTESTCWTSNPLPNCPHDRQFGYDSSDHLTIAWGGTGLWNQNTPSNPGPYTIDGMEDLANVFLGTAEQLQFNYSTGPRYSSVTDNTRQTTKSIAYDSAGNETLVGTSAYSYTARNLLATGDGLSYTYDADGIRTVTSGVTGLRYSLYSDKNRLLSESNVTSGTPNIKYDYIWFGDNPIAQETISGSEAGTYWTFDDSVGAPVLLMNNSGSIVWRIDMTPGGLAYQLRAGTAIHQPLRLLGQEAEQFASNSISGDTDRYYNVFRWYRPSWQRYTQPDPAGQAAGINPYIFVSNNPVSLVDPLGLRCWQKRFLVTAYSDVAPGADWSYYTTIAGTPDNPGNVGPGTVAVANSDTPPIPFGASVNVIGPYGEVDYTGVVHDTGAGWFQPRPQFNLPNGVPADQWLDIWLPKDQALNWGARWRDAVVCDNTRAACPSI